MKERIISVCPFCGNRAGIETYEDRYHCPACDCDRLFDEEDIVREDYRHRISRILSDTDEDRQMECSIPIGEDSACGLSSLELPEVVSCYQVPGEGTIWFHIYGYVNPVNGEKDYMNFDDLETCDLKRLAEGLEEQVFA